MKNGQEFSVSADCRDVQAKGDVYSRCSSNERPALGGRGRLLRCLATIVLLGLALGCPARSWGAAPVAGAAVTAMVVSAVANGAGVISMVYDVISFHTDYEEVRASVFVTYYLDYNRVRYGNAVYYCVRTVSDNPMGDRIYQTSWLAVYDDGRVQGPDHEYNVFDFDIEHQDYYCSPGVNYQYQRIAFTQLSLGYDVLKYANSSLIRSPNPLPVYVKWEGTTLHGDCDSAYGDEYEATRAEAAPRNDKVSINLPRPNLLVPGNGLSVTLR